MKKQDSSKKGQHNVKIRTKLIHSVTNDDLSLTSRLFATVPGVLIPFGALFRLRRVSLTGHVVLLCPYSVCNLLDKEIRYGKGVCVSQCVHGMNSF